MKKKTKELLIVSMVLTLFIGGFSTSVSASVSSNKQQKEIPQQVTNNEISLILSDDLIKQVDQYIEVKNKRFKISNQQELKEEIGTKQFQIVKSQVKIANKQLSDFHKNDLTVEGNVVSNKFNIDVKDHAC